MEQNSAIPVHIGLVLDGNRRWAKSQKITNFEGHYAGYQNLKLITKYAIDQGVSYVSAFVFSIENWSRTKSEIKYLMGLILRILTKDLAELNRENIKVVWLGSTDKLSDKIIKAIAEAEEKTKSNTRGTLCLCFNYGGYQEIVDSVKKIIKSGVSADEVDQSMIEKSLYAPEIPPIDLIIRTSGEQRTSGFMLYRSAYSELYFSKKHWPEFKEKDLDEAFADYAKRHRRFGE